MQTTIRRAVDLYALHTRFFLERWFWRSLIDWRLRHLWNTPSKAIDRRVPTLHASQSGRPREKGAYPRRVRCASRVFRLGLASKKVASERVVAFRLVYGVRDSRGYTREVGRRRLAFFFSTTASEAAECDNSKYHTSHYAREEAHHDCTGGKLVVTG